MHGGFTAPIHPPYWLSSKATGTDDDDGHGERVRERVTEMLLATLSAGLMMWAVPPHTLGWLAWVALIPLVFAIATAGTTLRAFVCGWWYGSLLVAVSIHWLAPAIQRFGDLSSISSLVIFALVPIQAGLSMGLFAALLQRAHRAFPALPMAFLAPVMLTSAEFVMPELFDWNTGFTQAAYPGITQITDVTGVIGLSFLIALVNGALFDLGTAMSRRQRLPWRSLCCTLALVAGALVYSDIRLAEIDEARARAPKLKIGVVQGNIALDEMSDPNQDSQQFERYLSKSRQLVRQGAELIVWPEGAYPYVYLRNMTEDWPSGSEFRLTRDLGVPLLVGTTTMSPTPPDVEAVFYNSAHLIAPDGRIAGTYAKHLLFPFNEYVPLSGWFPSLRAHFPMARYNAGQQRSLLSFGPYRIGPLICFEDIKPHFVRDIVPLHPNLLVTLSSDAWFGSEVAPQQHLALAIFRSIELRLDAVRATTNGISAIIDAGGRVTVQTRAIEPARLPGVKAFGLTGTVALLDAPRSFYARYGDAFAWLNLALATVLLLLPRVRDQRGRGLAVRGSMIRY